MNLRIDIHHHFDELPGGGLEKLLRHILSTQGTVMATQAELAQSLTDIKTQLDKAQAEIVAKVADLEAAIAAAGATTPDVDAALAALKGAAQALDDLNPDAPPAP